MLRSLSVGRCRKLDKPCPAPSIAIMARKLVRLSFASLRFLSCDLRCCGVGLGLGVVVVVSVVEVPQCSQ